MPLSSSLSPLPSAQAKVGNSASGLLSKEYREAVSSLNEENMNKACHLLMKAYEDETKADCTEAIEDELLELYFRSQDALNVIRKQQPVLVTKVPSLAPGATSLNGLKKRAVMTSKHGIHPSHKTSMSALKKGMMPMAMKRMQHGKVRGKSVSPPPSEDMTSSSPPPSALSFLAKLNRDPNEAPKETKKKAKPRKKIEEDNNNNREGQHNTEDSKKKRKPSPLQVVPSSPKRRKTTTNFGPPPSSSSGSEADGNIDGDTSADETYKGNSELATTQRKRLSRRAKPEASSLGDALKSRKGKEPPSKEESPSPTRRRNPRRGRTD